MFKTQTIKCLSEAIYDLEVNVSRAVHKAENYTIENGMVVTESVKDIRNKIMAELKILDEYLFNHVDDGR